MSVQRTPEELAKFYTYLGQKGLMNERTAGARAQAALQVLSILDANEKQDLATLDREGVFRRFVNKNGQRFTPGSLQTYKHRFNSAIEEFLAYTKDPVAYKPTTPTRERVRRTSDQTPAPSTKPATRGAQPSTPSAPAGLLTYPLPLPSGTVAQLLLPATITYADANRIVALVSAMVKALAMKDVMQEETEETAA